MYDEAACERDPALVPITDGIAYRVDMRSRSVMVTRELARELKGVLERFAREAGFGARHPVEVRFRPGIFGHHRVGRAADIYGVGDSGMEIWKCRWDAAQKAGARDGESDAMQRERTRNLGWRLYKSLQRYGRWSQPPGYPIQLFGPWTREEGPWNWISDFLLRAHRDHIHVAR